MTSAHLLHDYANGNAQIKIYSDGTRIIEAPDRLNLEYPLNIDIRVSTRCAFGRNPATGRAVCDFCHESATTDGTDADLNALFDTLYGLPAGIELAVGCNQVTHDLVSFFEKCKTQGWIINCTVNQGLIRRDQVKIQYLIDTGCIRGLGISYRRNVANIPQSFLDYANTVVHVIAGIDTIEEIKALADQGVRKILVLGEKDFGFNKGCVKLTTENHRSWYRRVHELFKLFEVVSFDNLALEQLNVRRFVINWAETYQHEYSFYINAVDQYFAPSSRSDDVQSYSNGLTPSAYFRSLFPEFAAA